MNKEFERLYNHLILNKTDFNSYTRDDPKLNFLIFLFSWYISISLNYIILKDLNISKLSFQSFYKNPAIKLPQQDFIILQVQTTL